MTKYPPPKKYNSQTGQAQWDSQYQQRPYPTYRGRFEMSHGIQDDHIWSTRNYISWDPEKNAKGWSRQPFYIVDDPIRQTGSLRDEAGIEIIPIFMPVEIQYVRDVVMDYFDGFPREFIRHVPYRSIGAVAQRLTLDSWPIYDVIDRKRGNTRAPSRGVWVLQEKTHKQLGKAVADILLWHSVLLPTRERRHESPHNDVPVVLDQQALDQWAVVATMFAESAIERLR